MSRFNKTKKDVAKTRNHEGAVAYNFLDPKLKFINTAAGMGFLSRGFYQSEKEQLDTLLEMVRENPEFAATVAAHLRNDHNYRTVPLIILAALTKTHNVRKLVPYVVKRADEMAEVLAIYKYLWGNDTLANYTSKGLLKGIKDVTHNFDRYQYAKYNRTKAEVTLRDVLRLVHPRPKDEEHDAIFEEIINGTLAAPPTWEVILSAAGEKSKEAKLKALTPLVESISSRGKLPSEWQNLPATLTDEPMTKRDAWNLILSLGKRFPYMAALRNLRNIVDAGVSENRIKALADRLADPCQVSRSKQLPFRYLSAAKALVGYGGFDGDTGAFDRISTDRVSESTINYVIAKLEDAVRLSADNLPKYEGSTVIGCDVSGSMDTPISHHSSIRLYEIGLLFGILTSISNPNNAVGAFAELAEFYTAENLKMFENHPLRAAAKAYDQMGHLGYMTNGHLVIHALLDLYEKKRIGTVDRVILFTDMQLWNTSRRFSYEDTKGPLQKAWNAYKKVAPDAKLYIINLEGYTTCPVNPGRDDVVNFAGWSENILRYIAQYENSRDVIDEISAKYPSEKLVSRLT
jgi:hypothetical protein